MITVIKRPRVLRSYLTYDLEWIPSKFTSDGRLQLRMVGVFDGERYRWYEGIEAFLRSELTHRNRGKWFYAHAGGLADFQFVLEAMLKLRGFSIKASFSGSSAIIVHVTRGKNSWHFIDSYWLMRDNLRNIGKWVGIEKGNEDESEEFYATAPIHLLRDYNEVDCIILYRAIEYFEQVLLDLGGQLKMTQASSAMELFRRRFLKQDIETSSAVNDIARNAYFASRVEVFSRECDSAFYYDINSSFPYAMTFPIPGNLMGAFQKQLPKVGLYLAECDIEVPATAIPPTPKRVAGRIFFPVGKWRGWYSNVDLRLLEEQGGRILRVHESLAFEPNTDCRDYALTLYGLRKKAEGFPKLAYKYLMNSLYGKFAESEWKNGFVVDPADPDQARAQGMQMLFPGCFLFEHKVPVPHMHVPISAHITAIARRTIYQYMGYSSKVHYCDTDGFSSDDELRLLGDELGDIKLEKILRSEGDVPGGRFVNPKVYRLNGTDANGKPLAIKDSIKAKGFSRMDIERFEKLRLGEEVEYTRMRRIKEVLRSGDFTPREGVITKKLSADSLDKRFFYPDGESRPWHVHELESLDKHVR